MMNIPLVDLKSQLKSIRHDIDNAISRVLDSTQFIGGDDKTRFEADFAQFCNVKHAIGCSSGTTALHLALVACGVKPGDEVITTAHTFIATAEAIIHAGAKPVFVDIDPITYNIDSEKVKAAITNKTSAIIAVHLYGQCADMDPLLSLCKKHNLKLIEDAAQAHGATYKGKKAGSIGDAATFSFYPGKNLGAYGDAGMMTTQHDTIAELARALLDHGRTEKYKHHLVGYNYRIDNMQAAVLNVKLKHLAQWTQARQSIAAYYSEHLNNESLMLPQALHGDHARHLYVIRTSHRDALQQYLKEQGISSGIHYPIPLHLQPAFAYLNYKVGAFPETEKAAAEILSLPIYPEFSREQQNYVVSHVNSFVTNEVSQPC